MRQHQDARDEADAGTLEPEHLAMSLLMATPTLFDWLMAEQVESIRQA